MASLRVLGLLGAWLFACSLYSCTTVPTGQVDSKEPERRYFASPQEAVILVTELLRKENWTTLTRYYDLSDSKVDRKELESGRFFIRTERPTVAHPGGFWRYKHPFPPGFKFDRVNATADPSVIVVVVSVEIDQGGGVKQRGLSEFKMRKSVKGYQILPP